MENTKRIYLSALVYNRTGVLLRVAGLFARRGYNVVSLTVSETESPEFSRMTIVSDVEEYITRDSLTPQEYRELVTYINPQDIIVEAYTTDNDIKLLDAVCGLTDVLHGVAFDNVWEDITPEYEYRFFNSY